MRNVRRAMLIFPLSVGVLLTGGCGKDAGCSLSGSAITCEGETFDECVVVGCSEANLGCQNPPTGCHLAPGMVLERFEQKGAYAFYLCGDPLTTCGTWTEAACQVTVTTYSGPAMTYTIHDASCP
jgi:hypothetical protein